MENKHVFFGIIAGTVGKIQITLFGDLDQLFSSSPFRAISAMTISFFRKRMLSSGCVPSNSAYTKRET
jgi:hypothetical protein